LNINCRTYGYQWAKSFQIAFIQISWLIFYREINAVCFQIHTKHINTAVFADRVIFECHTGGTNSYHWVKISYISVIKISQLNVNRELYAIFLRSNQITLINCLGKTYICCILNWQFIQLQLR